LFSVALAILGVGAATILVGWFGFDRVAQSVTSVGAGAFALYTWWQAAVLVFLGIAWWVLAHAQPRQLPIFMWGRMVRDSAGSCLPFSQLGGYAIGARAVTLHGVPTSVAVISSVVDVTAEFVAQILFLVFGLATLLARGRDVTATGPIGIGMGAALIAFVIAMRTQRHIAPLFVKFGRRILGQWFASDPRRRAASETELRELYGHTRRVAIGTMLHLAGWFAKGAGNWIAFAMLGAPIDMASAVAIEALLHAVLAVAFVVPGYAGVQEAGYASIGALFGAPPEISLSVSILRRARDLAIGVPVLLLWQIIELRRLRKTRSTA
jgi:putative membrane protein